MSPEAPIQTPVRDGNKCNARICLGPCSVVVEQTSGFTPVCVLLKDGIDSLTGEMKFKACHNPGGVPGDCPAVPVEGKNVVNSSLKQAA